MCSCALAPSAVARAAPTRTQICQLGRATYTPHAVPIVQSMCTDVQSSREGTIRGPLLQNSSAVFPFTIMHNRIGIRRINKRVYGAVYRHIDIRIMDFLEHPNVNRKQYICVLTLNMNKAYPIPNF